MSVRDVKAARPAGPGSCPIGSVSGVRRRRSAGLVARRRLAGKAAGTERGFSLVEVIIALGLLTAVLVAIGSMFVLGQSSVRSGREMTEATSIAQHILEDVNKLSYNGLNVFFVGAQNLNTLTSYTADTRVSGSYAQSQYKALIDDKLFKGYALIVLQPIGGNVKPAVWATGEAIRITVTVYWTELRKNRSLAMETVRF